MTNKQRVKNKKKCDCWYEVNSAISYYFKTQKEGFITRYRTAKFIYCPKCRRKL